MTVRRVVALAVWAYAVWLLLTWTATFEQLVFGAMLAVAVALAFAPLGDVVGPWRLLDPVRLGVLIRLLAVSVIRIVRANVSLARRVWSPRRPLDSGMVVVATDARTDGELAAVGLITSVIVDNQVIDLDRRRHVLQYHAVSVPRGTRRDKAAAINAPIERLVARLDRSR
jgi:multicomponent Na+:H+ antiporter subunit E